MSRIQGVFQKAKSENRGALIVYICAGDPNLNTTVELVKALAEAGVDIVELGMPYTNPVADGPTIQEAAQRALKAGTTVQGILEAIREIRKTCEIPLVIMSSVSPLFRFGLSHFATEAASAGVDGILMSDLPPGEAVEWCQEAEVAGLDTIFLVAPSTPVERIKQIADVTTGFVYAVARAGTTGARTDLPEELPALVQKIKSVTDKPVAVGFGVSTAQHVKQVCEIADGAIVGSAMVKIIAQASGNEVLVVKEFAQELVQGTVKDYNN